MDQTNKMMWTKWALEDVVGIIRALHEGIQTPAEAEWCETHMDRMWDFLEEMRDELKPQADAARKK